MTATLVVLLSLPTAMSSVLSAQGNEGRLARASANQRFGHLPDRKEVGLVLDSERKNPKQHIAYCIHRHVDSLSNYNHISPT